MRLKLLCLTLFFVLLPTTILAQTEVTNSSAVGISIEYPDDWRAEIVSITESANALYLANSDATMDAIINNPTSPMRSGRMAVAIYPPSLFERAASTLDELSELYVDAEWEEATINGKPAYRWDYEDNRTQGFALIYELSDGRFTFSIGDTAPGELTDELDDLFVEIISSVEPYSLVNVIDDGLDFSETAIIDDFIFSFQYPENWQISEVNEINDSVIISPDISSDEFNLFLGSSFLIVSQLTLESLGLNDENALESGEISMALLESYAELAEEQDGLAFSTVELIDIDDRPVGRVFAEDLPTIFMFVLNEDTIVQIWIISDDEDTKEALEDVVEDLIATVSTDNVDAVFQMNNSINSIRGNNTETGTSLPDIPIRADDLNESYTMENGIVFDYIEGWSVLEDDTGLVLVSNVQPIEDFTAQPGEFLLIISAVSSDVMELRDVITRSLEISSIMSEFPDFDVNIFRIDSSEELSDIGFDVGEPAIDWNYSSGLLASPGSGVNGAVTIIMSQDRYSENLATSIINPIILTFRTEEG